MMHRLWCGINAIGTADIVVTFADLGADVACAKELVGEKVWHRFFGEADVGASHVCPAQLVFCLAHVLKKQAESFAKDAAAQQAHDDARARIKSIGDAQAKRRRI